MAAGVTDLLTGCDEGISWGASADTPRPFDTLPCPEDVAFYPADITDIIFGALDASCDVAGFEGTTAAAGGDNTKYYVADLLELVTETTDSPAGHINNATPDTTLTRLRVVNSSLNIDDGEVIGQYKDTVITDVNTYTITGDILNFSHDNYAGSRLFSHTGIPVGLVFTTKDWIFTGGNAKDDIVTNPDDAKYDVIRGVLKMRLNLTSGDKAKITYTFTSKHKFTYKGVANPLSGSVNCL